MMFQKKIDRSMKWLKEKNKALDKKAEEWSEGKKEHNDLKLEAKDIIAIILSALMIFGPLILLLLIIAIWAGI
jgi:hypothetical protein